MQKLTIYQSLWAMERRIPNRVERMQQIWAELEQEQG